MIELIPTLIATAWIAVPYPADLPGKPAPSSISTAAGCTQPSDWIEENLAEAQVFSGIFEGRVAAESPAWVRDATITGARYGIAIRTGTDTDDRRVAVTKVSISNLRSKTNYGAGIRTYRSGPGIELFLEDVTIRPDWPDWTSYSDTNFDGIVLDGAAAFYARNLTISEWNADAAIDNKAGISQIVGLRVSGPGHRPLRYWRSGPHYLVDAQIDKPDAGTLLWISDCDRVTLRIYQSRFNGAPRLTDEMVDCARGRAPDIAYLSEDPAISGELHPFLSGCPSGVRLNAGDD